MDYLDQIAALEEAAESLLTGRAKVDLYQEATRLADIHNNLSEGYRLRSSVMESAQQCGDYKAVLEAFTWSVNMSDHHPTLYDPISILDNYPNVISYLVNYPEITRARIEHLIEDMKTRFAVEGIGLRVVHVIRMCIYTTMGDESSAQSARLEFQTSPHDDQCDTKRFEESMTVSLLCNFAHYKEGVESAKTIMKGIEDDPHFALLDSSTVLIPLLMLGQVDDAIRIQKAYYKQLLGPKIMFACQADHIEFFARIDSFNEAIRIIKKFVVELYRYNAALEIFYFQLSVWILMQRIQRIHAQAADSKLKGILRKVPKLSRVSQPLDRYMFDSCSELAQQYDQRNGNGYFAWRIELAMQAASLTSPLGSDP